MSPRNWNSLRANGPVHALRLCKEYAQAKRNLSVERIADRMGVSHDSLYKWLATGRMPANLLAGYQAVCGTHYFADWLASDADRLVMPMPKGRKVESAELLDVNSSCADMLQAITTFYADPAKSDAEKTLATVRHHLELVAFHHANVARYTQPELDFEA